MTRNPDSLAFAVIFVTIALVIWGVVFGDAPTREGKAKMNQDQIDKFALQSLAKDLPAGILVLALIALTAFGLFEGVKAFF